MSDAGLMRHVWYEVHRQPRRFNVNWLLLLLILLVITLYAVQVVEKHQAARARLGQLQDQGCSLDRQIEALQEQILDLKTAILCQLINTRIYFAARSIAGQKHPCNTSKHLEQPGGSLGAARPLLLAFLQGGEK